MKVKMFKTDNCVACRAMQRFVDDYEVEVINLSHPENSDEIITHGLRAVPTTIVFNDDGEEIDRLVGAVNQEDFANFVKRG